MAWRHSKGNQRALHHQLTRIRMILPILTGLISLAIFHGNYQRLLVVLPVKQSDLGARSLSAVICAVVKDDEAYIDEWVDYHHALGFQHFFIYDYSNAFEMKQWAENKGNHITAVHYPGELGERDKVYADCIKRANLGDPPATWAAFFDVQDFLILKRHNMVIEFLREFCSSGSLSINLLLFGSSGCRVYSPKPVTKRFLYRDSDPQDQVRLILRLDTDSNQSLPLDTNGHEVAGHVNPQRPSNVVIFHHYLRSVKEQHSKMGTAIYFKDEKQIANVSEPNDELLNMTVFDDSAWQALKRLVPRYKLYDFNLAGSAPRFRPSYNGTVAICAVVKYEEAYIDEWVDYHHALGISHFYIYDNSPEYEMEQWGHEKGQHVTVKHFPGIEIQGRAYLDCLNRFVVRDGHQWVGMIDADEMVHLKDNNHIVDLLHERCGSGSLCLNWNIFGPGGQDVYQPLPFTKQFKYRQASNVDRHVKCFSKVSDVDLTRNPNPHFQYLKNGSHHDVFGRQMKPPFYWNQGGPSEVSVVHHYNTKSFKEYVAKRMRGRADRLYNMDELINKAKNKMLNHAFPSYSEAGWNATKTFLPLYQLFD